VGRVKRHALPPLEAAREVCSADGPDDGDPGRSQAQGLHPSRSLSAPAGGMARARGGRGASEAGEAFFEAGYVLLGGG
jgi:hypothetical protein